MNDQKSTSGGQFIADPNGTPEKSQNHSQSKQNKEGPTESTPINKNRNSDDTSISAISAYFKKCSMNSDSDSNTSNIDYDTEPVDSFLFTKEPLTRTEYETWEKNIISWKTLEQDAKLNHNSGLSYVYLLLDSSITQDLPNRTDQFTSDNRIQIWNTFLKSIFYIGQGKANKDDLYYCRFFKHLENANNSSETTSQIDKGDKIREIWSAGYGVVCVQVFHNSKVEDALARERAMIEAIGLKNLNLSNKINGKKKNTTIENWEDELKKKLGCHLLFRAMYKYLCDGERQLKRSIFKNTICKASEEGFVYFTSIKAEYKTWEKDIISWKKCEQDKLGGKDRFSYVYLFLDPRITNDLPNRINLSILNDRIELWNTFIKSIFYIGKGKLRTTIVDDDYCHHLQHLNSAFSEYHAVPRPKVDEKTQKIWEIWDEKNGVVCVQVFHNSKIGDAYIREKSMVDAIAGLKKKQFCHKNTSKIPGREKLGCYLLHCAMHVYFYDGERQLKQSLFKKKEI